jgi:uncharacterized protein involved in exopolysaccharide biosynthesis
MDANEWVRPGQVPADFSDYARILLTRRRLLVVFVGVACVLAVLLSLIGPETYRAHVSLLPEESRGITLGRLGDSPAILDMLSRGGGRRDGRTFLEMLASRSVMEGVVKKCDLIRVFRFEKLPPDVAMEEAIKRLRDAAGFTETDAGIIQIQVSTVTPFFPDAANRHAAANLCAVMANTFAEELNRVNQVKSTSRARAVRIYLEDQIHATEQAMQTTADSLVKLQLANHAVALDEQTKAAMEGAGELHGRIVAAEVDLGILQSTMLPGNPAVRSAELKLEELRKQYDKMQFGLPPGTGGAESRDLQVPFTSLPEVAQQLGMLTRDLKIHQTVYELLNQQYYQAKIQETGDIPSMSVLDEAIPPVYRSWPQRKMLLLSTFLLSFFVAALLAFGLEYRDRRRGLPVVAGPGSLARAWQDDRRALGTMLRRR